MSCFVLIPVYTSPSLRRHQGTGHPGESEERILVWRSLPGELVKNRGPGLTWGILSQGVGEEPVGLPGEQEPR